MFTRLLVPLDRSPLAEQALGPAAAIARGACAAMDLVLVHQPVASGGFGDLPWNAEQIVDEDRYLETIAGELHDGASVSASHAVLRGNAVEMICARAYDVSANLIVMTSHGRTGLSRAWLGSVADGVLRRAGIPVLVLRAIERKADRLVASGLFKHLLIPLDGSPHSSEILASAAALARSCGARVTLLRVIEPVLTPSFEAPIPVQFGMPETYPPSFADKPATQRLVAEAEQHLLEVAATLAGQGVPQVETRVVVEWAAAQAILDFARGNHVDVIAMSTHGRGASRLLVGSVADKVLRASGLPVLLEHPISVRAATRPSEAASDDSVITPFCLSP
ncbi:MAG: universal stress protein [bacterium]